VSALLSVPVPPHSSASCFAAICQSAIDPSIIQAVRHPPAFAEIDARHNGPNHRVTKVPVPQANLQDANFLRLRFLNIGVPGKSHPESIDGCPVSEHPAADSDMAY